MNTIMIMGRLTKDPELKETKKGTPYVSFTLASRNFADKTAFIPCIAFERTAAILEKYAQKGTRISVRGFIETVQKEDGRNNNIVKVEQLELADNKESTETVPADAAAMPSYTEEDIDEMELPF